MNLISLNFWLRCLKYLQISLLKLCLFQLCLLKPFQDTQSMISQCTTAYSDLIPPNMDPRFSDYPIVIIITISPKYNEQFEYTQSTYNSDLIPPSMDPRFSGNLQSFTNLDPNWSAMSENEDKAILKIEKLSIFKIDFDSLSKKEWLRDAILEAYFMCISISETYVMHSVMLTKICTTGSATTVLRKNFLKLDLIVGPVQIMDKHWCLFIANIKERTLTYIDPLGASNVEKSTVCNNWKHF